MIDAGSVTSRLIFSDHIRAGVTKLFLDVTFVDIVEEVSLVHRE